MIKHIEGPVAKVGDNVDTDQIIPARYLTTSEASELAAHVFEDCPDQPVIEPGVIVVGGRNFGSGSSREHAPLAIQGAGVAAVLAESYARIFFRNAIDIGLLALEVPGVSRLKNGDQLKMDLEAGRIEVVGGETLTINPVPEFITEIMEAGGLIDWIKTGGMD